jgi:hypothetical protein
MTGLAIASALVASVVEPAMAIDVRGTWTGTAKCKAYPSESAPFNVQYSVTVLISQIGVNVTIDIDALNMRADGSATDNGAASSKKGVIAAGTCDQPTAVVGGIFARAKVDPDGKATLNGTVVGHSLFGPLKCTLKATRTNDVNPLVAGCD